jgi:hypothetical protein
MTQDLSSEAVRRPALAPVRFRIWHLWLLALFVAMAIVNIRDQRRSEAALVGLAAGGFVLYGLLAWGAWCIARRLRARLGTIPVLALYLVAMAGLFLVATVVYLLLEYGYLVGGLGIARLPGRGWIFS